MDLLVRSAVSWCASCTPPKSAVRCHFYLMRYILLENKLTLICVGKKPCVFAGEKSSLYLTKKMSFSKGTSAIGSWEGPFNKFSNSTHTVGNLFSTSSSQKSPIARREKKPVSRKLQRSCLPESLKKIGAGSILSEVLFLHRNLTYYFYKLRTSFWCIYYNE